MVRDLMGRVAAFALASSFYGVPVGILALSEVPEGPEIMVADESERAAVFTLPPPVVEEAAAVEEAVVEPQQEAAPDAAQAANTRGSTTQKARTRRTPTSRTVKVVKSTSKATKKGQKRKCLDEDAGIERTGTNSYAIDGQIVDYYSKHLKKAQKLAAVSWFRNDKGKIEGFKVRRMRCGNVLRQAGLKNGDVIHTVNGKRVKSVPGAIAAYTKVRKSNVLKLEITRGGQKMRLKYNLT